MNANDKFDRTGKMFVVALLCARGWGRSRSASGYHRWMSSGINEDRRGKFFHTADKSRAMKFAKLTAQDLVVRLKKDYGVTARVENEDGGVL